MFYDDWFSNPAFQSLALPMVVALLTSAALRLAGGRGAGPALAGAGIGLGFLAGDIAVMGLPAWPPLAAVHKLSVIAVAGIAVGVALDLGRAGRNMRIFAILAATFSITAWIGWPALTGGDGPATLRLAVLWALSAGILVSLDRPSGQAAGPAAMLCAAALGVSMLVVLSGSTGGAQLAAALAAACLGFFALAWPPTGLAFAASGQLGAGLPLVALVAGLMQTGDVELSALPMLLPVFLAGRLSGALLPSRAGLEGVVRPVLTFAIALVPVLAAAGVHRISREPLFWF